MVLCITRGWNGSRMRLLQCYFYNKRRAIDAMLFPSVERGGMAGAEGASHALV